MPSTFLRTFADRLDRTAVPSVSLAYNGAPLVPGQIYLAPGGDYHLEVRGRTQLQCQLTEGALVSGHRPSVNVMMHSMAAFEIGAVEKQIPLSRMANKILSLCQISETVKA